MDSYKLLAVFNYAHELVSVKALLESENIDCQVKDELTVQVQNFVSNAVGGIKLLVHQSNMEKARNILAGNPFLIGATNENIFLKKLAKKTDNIALLKSLKVELRLLILAAIFFGILVFGVLNIMS